MFLTIIAFFIVLSILVFAHELGHFWMARRMGLVPKEFGFGLPPRLAGIYKDKKGKWKKVLGKKEVPDAVSTIYSINWIPLGGFVNLEEDESGGDNPNHFSNKLPWQRALIISAGVIMNIVLAIILISIGYMIGLPQVIEKVGPGAKISHEQIQIIEILPNSPAANAGLQMGDIILNVNGQNFKNEQELQDFTNANENNTLQYKIKRGQTEINKDIIPVKINNGDKAQIGIAIVETGIVRYSFFLALWHGLKTTIFSIWAIFVAFCMLIQDLILGKQVGAQLAGPIGIAALTGQMARMGFVYVLQFTALLSINLAIINALPFPALDGGRLLFLGIEKVKGSPVKKEIEAKIHYIGFGLLMLLVIVVTYNDIARHFSFFTNIWQKLSG